uniref:hypothetical protein n=1 Tax=Kitasatospora sp. NBC_01519 TaxID=2903576 RepID=UPI002F906FE5
MAQNPQSQLVREFAGQWALGQKRNAQGPGPSGVPSPGTVRSHQVHRTAAGTPASRNRRTATTAVSNGTVSFIGV